VAHTSQMPNSISNCTGHREARDLSIFDVDAVDIVMHEFPCFAATLLDTVEFMFHRRIVVLRQGHRVEVKLLCVGSVVRHPQHSPTVADMSHHNGFRIYQGNRHCSTSKLRIELCCNFLVHTTESVA